MIHEFYTYFVINKYACILLFINLKMTLLVFNYMILKLNLIFFHPYKRYNAK